MVPVGGWVYLNTAKTHKLRKDGQRHAKTGKDTQRRAKTRKDGQRHAKTAKIFIVDKDMQRRQKDFLRMTKTRKDGKKTLCFVVRYFMSILVLQSS